MDESWLRLIYVLTDLIAPLAVGYIIKEWHIVSEKKRIVTTLHSDDFSH